MYERVVEYDQILVDSAPGKLTIRAHGLELESIKDGFYSTPDRMTQEVEATFVTEDGARLVFYMVPKGEGTNKYMFKMYRDNNVS